MNDDELRDLLARVKAGELSAEDAAALLGSGGPGEDHHDREGAGDEPPRRRDTPHDDGDDADATPADADFSAVRVVRLRATANRTRVVADPSVKTVTVSGRHRLRVEGDRVVVENEIGEDRFRFGGEGGPYLRIAELRGRGIAGFRGHEVLEVRVNPALTVEFDCDAGMIEILGVTTPLTGRVNAGNAVIEDFAGPFTLSVNAGKLRARGRLDGGRSSIDVNVGKADVILEPGSNVRIIRTATLGSAEADDDVVGTGSGTLRVTCSLGAVRVQSPEAS